MSNSDNKNVKCSDCEHFLPQGEGTPVCDAPLPETVWTYGYLGEIVNVDIAQTCDLFKQKHQ